MAIDALHSEQKCVATSVMSTVGQPRDNIRGNFMFVDAEAGTGKTHLAKVVAQTLRADGKIVACCGTTGLVALNHDGGTTAHFLFGIPVHDKFMRDDMREPKISKLDPASPQCQYLRVCTT